MHRHARRLRDHMLLAAQRKLARWGQATRWIRRIFKMRGLKSERLQIDHAPDGSIRIRDGAKILGEADVRASRADWALNLESGELKCAGGHIEVSVNLLFENVTLAVFVGDLLDYNIGNIVAGNVVAVHWRIIFEAGSQISDDFPELGMKSILPLIDIEDFSWAVLNRDALVASSKPCQLYPTTTDDDGVIIYQGESGSYYLPIAYRGADGQWHQLWLPGLTIDLKIAQGGCLLPQ